jgi:curved DNA-binding protein CbpA
MENIGFPGARTTRAEPAAPEHTPAPSSSGEVPSAAEGVAPTSASSEDQALAEQIERRFRAVHEAKDFFTLLGVPRSTTDAVVKAAFLEQAKVFHPDRLPESLRSLSAKVTAIFEKVNEAHEYLQNQAKRVAYLESLQEPQSQTGTNSSNPAEAAVRYKLGEALVRKQDYSGAEYEFRQAQVLDPKPLYLAAEAWAVYLDPSRKDEVARAKQMMLDAARQDPRCDRAHYQLGVIARVEGNLEIAEERFREALSVNRRHAEASQELRLIEMRKKTGGKGFKRKLFGNSH